VASHRGAVPADQIGCAVLTVSDTRTEADDESGLLIRTLLETGGHPVPFYAIVPDDPVAIRAGVTEIVERRDVRALVVTGGTGIAPRDVTIESIGSLWTRELPGFGETFRALSFAEIGPPALLSRATAGGDRHDLRGGASRVEPGRRRIRLDGWAQRQSRRGGVLTPA